MRQLALEELAEQPIEFVAGLQVRLFHYTHINFSLRAAPA
jgi:hypothetical protein